MRSFCTAAFLSVASVCLVTANSTRKSLRFGPRRVATRFVTEPKIPSSATNAGPFEVARAFLHSYTSSDYFIRDDSYTDKNTGVTHVYVRQLVGGLEVADGDINLNIHEGRVLSFGDSFFQGFPLSNDAPSSASHATYCADFASARVAVASGNSQPILAQKAAAADSGKDALDPSRAALYFMIAAHPDPSFADDLAGNFDAILDRMTVSYEHDGEGHTTNCSAIVSGLPGSVNLVKARVVYVQVPAENNQFRLHATWRLEVEMADNWYEAYISTNDPSAIVSVIDWAADSSIPGPDGHLNALEAKIAMGRPVKYTEASSYKVWKWTINDPSLGERSVEPASYDPIASPLGWHTISNAKNPRGSPGWVGKDLNEGADSYLNFTTTWGNNVFAHENWQGGREWKSNRRPEGGELLKFEFEYGAERGLEKEPRDYMELSVTQLFYTTNLVHDLYYRYGFDELAGNFQQDNYGRGGRDGDAVIASAQDGGGYNNANFVTPPDGQHGRCRMYIWNTATPFRDGSLEAGILIHELSHGLSIRLTGGPSNSGCMIWGESGGMGEGWGDFLATAIRSTREDRDYFPMGSWASNQPQGVRNRVYSTNTTVNPSTYETLNCPEYWTLQAIGEVWAEILWVVLERLVEEYGHSSTLFPPGPLEDGTIPVGDFYLPRVPGRPLVPKHGNTLMIQLVISGMKLQPCRPSFFEARDAIVAADRHLTGGKNHCLLWAAFSSRGLGTDAQLTGDTPWGGGKHTNGFKVPEVCE